MAKPLFQSFSAFPELVAVFSSRQDGDMKLRDLSAESEAQRAAFFKKQGIAPSRVVSVLAAHAADVILVGDREAGAVMKRVDGLITGEADIFLSVTAADCLVLYLYDPVSKTIGLLHAGWRGLARGIIQKALHQFPDPRIVRVGISPFIQACHFEVRADVLSAFLPHPEAVITREDKTYLDLGAVALRQLLEAGVNSEYIEISEDCTACLSERYFSYRRDGEPIQTMVAVFGRTSV